MLVRDLRSSFLAVNQWRLLVERSSVLNVRDCKEPCKKKIWTSLVFYLYNSQINYTFFVGSPIITAAFILFTFTIKRCFSSPKAILTRKHWCWLQREGYFAVITSDLTPYAYIVTCKQKWLFFFQKSYESYKKKKERKWCIVFIIPGHCHTFENTSGIANDIIEWHR